MQPHLDGRNGSRTLVTLDMSALEVFELANNLLLLLKPKGR